MNFKSLLLSLLTLGMAWQSMAQINILNAKTPDDIGMPSQTQKNSDNEKPLPYAYVDDRDILFSRMTWEKISLDERINFPLYFPIDTNNIGKERRSLYDVLVKNIKNGRIKNIYDDSYFTTKKSLNDIEASLVRADTTELGIEQLNAGERLSEEYIDRRNITSADIREYRIKGLWYFDKRQSELKYRLLGIAPVAPDVNFIDDESSDLVELFWVFFPEARDVLFQAKAFNPRNNAISLSFDRLLNMRRFNGYIYKEENIYEDRNISDYIPENALMQLLESERIKNKIRDFELDMWSN